MTGLNGRSVVVTRAPHQAAELATLLTERGATPLLYPCIDIVPPKETGALDEALSDATQGKFDWLVLTSANTVIALEKRIAALRLALPDSLNVAAIGPATAAEAGKRLGVKVDLTPDEFVSDALAAALTPNPSPGGRGEKAIATGLRILLPQSAIAEEALAERLRHRGAAVTVVPAYRNVIGSGGVDLPALLDSHKVDAITFTSGSTVANCLKRLEAEGSGLDALKGVVVACIGPKTADVARLTGLSIDVMPAEHTLEALVQALETHFLTETTGV